MTEIINEDFIIDESIFNPGKWVIIARTPEAMIKMNFQRFEGTKEEVLTKVKEWV